MRVVCVAVVSWLCSLFVIWLRLDLFGELALVG